MNQKFTNTLIGVAQPVPPIWFMRQAGRYHSHYKNLRKNFSFEKLCKVPELAAEVACGPILDFDYDVAILFSDILFPLELFGLGLSYNPGPTFSNYLLPSDTKKRISEEKIEKELSFQSDALRLTREALAKEKSLVGFVGGPWTILSYGLNMKQKDIVDISSDDNFIEKLLYDQIIPILRKNIQMQIKSGAEIVYVFDTNSLQLNENYFINNYLNVLKKELFIPFEKKLAYFTKNQSFYRQSASRINEMKLAGTVYSSHNGFNNFIRGKGEFFIQGNFSPRSLLKPHSEYLLDFKVFVSQIKRLKMKERSRWVCSLSHGVLPKTPEENIRHFINSIRDEFSEGV